jgi:hypothetical protein
MNHVECWKFSNVSANISVAVSRMDVYWGFYEALYSESSKWPVGFSTGIAQCVTTGSKTELSILQFRSLVSLITSSFRCVHQGDYDGPHMNHSHPEDGNCIVYRNIRQLSIFIVAHPWKSKLGTSDKCVQNVSMKTVREESLWMSRLAWSSIKNDLQCTWA